MAAERDETHLEDTRLGAILVESRIISERRLRQCLEVQALRGPRMPLGQILIQQGVVSERVLAELLRIQAMRRRRDAAALVGPEGAESTGLASTPAPTHGLLGAALAIGASDLVLSEGRVPLARVGRNVLRLRDEVMLGPEVWEIVREQLGEDAMERVARDGALTRELNSDLPARGRATVFRHLDGLALNLRIHPKSVRTPEQAGVAGPLVEAVQSGRGVILIAGDRNSGRTETFATLLSAALTVPGRSVHVLDRSFEYPTLGNGAPVTRRRLGSSATPMACGALRASLREDPDALFLSEVDANTAPLLLQAAENVEIVVACVRAKSVREAIERFLAMCPRHERARARSLLAVVGLGVVVTRTLAVQDGGGLTLATERLDFDATVRDLLRAADHERIDAMLRARVEEGCRSLDSSILEAVLTGVVDSSEAFPHVREKARFLDALTLTPEGASL
ncbi:MAG: ATPase, T2SS/T4P/T4SS family [Planctomycetota bacterium]